MLNLQHLAAVAVAVALAVAVVHTPVLAATITTERNSSHGNDNGSEGWLQRVSGYAQLVATIPHTEVRRLARVVAVNASANTVTDRPSQLTACFADVGATDGASDAVTCHALTGLAGEVEGATALLRAQNGADRPAALSVVTASAALLALAADLDTTCDAIQRRTDTALSDSLEAALVIAATPPVSVLVLELPTKAEWATWCHANSPGGAATCESWAAAYEPCIGGATRHWAASLASVTFDPHMALTQAVRGVSAAKYPDRTQVVFTHRFLAGALSSRSSLDSLGQYAIDAAQHAPQSLRLTMLGLAPDSQLHSATVEAVPATEPPPPTEDTCISMEFIDMCAICSFMPAPGGNRQCCCVVQRPHPQLGCHVPVEELAADTKLPPDAQIPVVSFAHPAVVHRATTVCLPALLVVGTCKGGTTALWSYLRAHSSVLSVGTKEVGIGLRDSLGSILDFMPHLDPAVAAAVTSRAAGVEGLLEGTATVDRVAVQAGDDFLSGHLTVDVSPWYMLTASTTAPRVRRILPGAKLVAVLRDPVDLVQSTFAMAMRRVWDLCVHFARECSVELERDPSQQAWLGCLALALRTKQMITSRLHVEASQLTQLLACSQRHLSHNESVYTTALCAFHAMRSISKTFKHWTSLRPRIMAETAAMEACVNREVVEENNGSLTHLAMVRELTRDCIQPVPGDIVGDFTEAVADQNFVWNSVVISLHYHALAPLLEQYPANQVLVLQFQDLVTNASATVDKITEFLGIHPLQDFVKQHSLSKAAVAQVVRRMDPTLEQLHGWTAAARDDLDTSMSDQEAASVAAFERVVGLPMQPPLRRELEAYFQPFNNAVQKLLQKHGIL